MPQNNHYENRYKPFFSVYDVGLVILIPSNHLNFTLWKYGTVYFISYKTATVASFQKFPPADSKFMLLPFSQAWGGGSYECYQEYITIHL